jgi:putative acetyltransferase
MCKIDIRAEGPEDISAVRSLLCAAFAQEQEARLVDQLRGAASTFAFVAIKAGQVVGHICFSPVTLEGECPNPLKMIGLAPLAVDPSVQRQGIGSALIRHGLAACAQLGYKAVVVLGHPTYYPKFGFIPAQQMGLGCEYPVPAEVFMVLELEPGVLTGCRGTVKYRPEFNK